MLFDYGSEGSIDDGVYMIEVTVTLYPPLRNNRFSKAAVSIETPATVQSLLNHLDIKDKDVESIYINGREGTFSHPLADGDKISFFPLIGGG